jgi:hypothetical protein
VNVTKEIGKFYQNKKQWNTAIGYYENRMLKVWISIWRRICFCFNRIRRQKSLKRKKSDGYGGCFPSQPQFYYYSGLAYNQLAQFKKAKEMLEMG